MKYLINADFPQNLSAMLGERGTCVRLPFSNSIPLPVGAHPDTLIGKLGGELFVSANDAKIIKTLDANGIKYRISHHGTGAGYPLDCALNFFTVGRYLFCRDDAVSQDVVKYAVSAGYEIVNVKQGYAHCSAAVMGDTVITADDGIFDALTHRGVRALHISAGSIKLPPFEYGFIGGACGMADDKTALFFGSLDFHPDGERIRAFCRDNGIRVVEGNGPLFDYGGFIKID